MKHTPGPWTQDGLRVKSPRGYICKALRPHEGGTFDAVDNAAFMTCAPDLLAERDALYRVLEPFAALYHSRLDGLGDGVPLYQHCDAVIRVGDVRQARAALDAVDGGPGKQITNDILD